jgi:DNA-binding NtrC family response regulator
MSDTPTLKILIVDDEPVMHKLLSSFIFELGHQSESTYNGPEALKAIEDQSFDLILTDVRMPGMDGLELLEKIHQSHPQLPVVVITGHGDPTMSEKAKALGAYDFIIKPVSLVKFMQLVKEIVNAKADS